MTYDDYNTTASMLANMFFVESPQEVTNLKTGFVEDMLRCNAPKGEDCAKSFSLVDPRSRQYFLPHNLSQDENRRKNLRISWERALGEKKKRYASFEIGVLPEMTTTPFVWKLFDYYLEGEKIFEEDLLFWTALTATQRILPSYSVAAAVLHIDERKGYTGNFPLKPPHFHFLCVNSGERFKEEVELMSGESVIGAEDESIIGAICLSEFMDWDGQLPIPPRGGGTGLKEP